MFFLCVRNHNNWGRVVISLFNKVQITALPGIKNQYLPCVSGIAGRILIWISSLKRSKHCKWAWGAAAAGQIIEVSLLSCLITADERQSPAELQVQPGTGLGPLELLQAQPTKKGGRCPLVSVCDQEVAALPEMHWLIYFVGGFI